MPIGWSVGGNWEVRWLDGVHQSGVYGRGMEPFEEMGTSGLWRRNRGSLDTRVSR